MFVESHVTLTLSADDARLAIEHSLAGHALQQHSAYAVEHGANAVEHGANAVEHGANAVDQELDLALTVGPRSGPFAKQVVAHTLDTRLVGNTFVIPLRWEATGATSRLYPALDANIGITPVDERTCVLSMVGSYTPPMGALGSSLDRAAMSRVATATIDAFVSQLATEATTGTRVGIA